MCEQLTSGCYQKDGSLSNPSPDFTPSREENGDETGRKKIDVERERKRRKGDWRLGKGTGN